MFLIVLREIVIVFLVCLSVYVLSKLIRKIFLTEKTKQEVEDATTIIKETINEAKALGIKGFIHKPLVLEELEKIVLAELNK